ncbi:MAG TPA: hypothetical protein G4O13_03815 [Dehalococcoidia bacterium]|nr:hypothetical protein [Dehalococcoidia bacterium]
MMFKLMGKLPAAGFVVLLLLPSLPGAGAAGFYGGDIAIDSLSATIDVADKADITVEYELTNSGDGAESVNLTYFPADVVALIDGGELSNPVAFEKGETKNLTLSYSLTLALAEYQALVFEPMLRFDDMAHPERVGSYDVELTLPQGVERLVYSSMDYDDTSTEDGRLVLIWSKEDIYQSSISVAWNTLDVNLAAVKTASPESITAAGELVEVEITIENMGDEEVQDITLRDSFFPGTFEAVAPLDEFETVESELSDPHLYWTKEIDSLAAGESVTCTYSVIVTALGLETRLDNLVVSVTGIPVSVSNDVVLYSELEERYGLQVSEGGFPTTAVIVVLVVIVAIIALLYLRRARKRV